MRSLRKPEDPVVVGEPVTFRFELDVEKDGTFEIDAFAPGKRPAQLDGEKDAIRIPMKQKESYEPSITFWEPGVYRIRSRPDGSKLFDDLEEITVLEKAQVPVAAREEVAAANRVMKVSLVPADASDSEQALLWKFISDVGVGLRFDSFAKYAKGKLLTKGFPASAYGLPTYRRLHKLSSKFVTKVALGQVPGHDENGSRAAMDLSYVKKEAEEERKGDASPYGGYPLQQIPFVEMIFVYWMEEAMLFQTLNQVVLRFANDPRIDVRDPLRRFSVSPLMPLQGIILGLGSEESHRLSVEGRRREYLSEYGFELIGKAISDRRPPVERRTQFPEAFHSLLHATHLFYKERDDKTIDADPFPLLSSLRELHLVLAMGANNRFADMPLRARIETLDAQWMLAQSEMGLYLGEPTMVPYEEPWMGRLDTMKSLQGWSNSSVTHFYDLAYHGEQLLLSVRHGRWNESTREGKDAENWALAWKNSVQRYIHAYRAVTGVDLAVKTDTTLPSVLLARRLDLATRT